MTGTISNYLQQNPRYKLIISKKEIDFVRFIDIGLQLSLAFNGLVDYKNIHFKLSSALETILEEGAGQNEEWGKYIALKNLGILFEPELQFSLPLFLENHATQYPVFLHWPGEMEGKKLYFLTKQQGTQIDLNDISFITI